MEITSPLSLDLPLNADKPSVAASYLQLLVEIVTERGFSAAELIDHLPISEHLLQEPGARISPLQWGLAVNRAMVLCDDNSLGYECGLRMRPTVNGYLGYAIMSSQSMAEALELLTRYVESRQRGFSISIETSEDYAAVELKQNHAIPVLRNFFIEHILVGIARGSASILGVEFDSEPMRGVEICFDWKEPPYHAEYSDRLPATRFSRSANVLRFPLKFLDAKPLLADPQASRQAVEQCERELAQLGGSNASVTLKTSAELILEPYKGYPEQDVIAEKLHMSPRTLARQLRSEGASYSQLLKHATQRDACQLLESSPMNITDIALYLGYINPANFTRAFRKWTGQTPQDWRANDSA